MGKRSSFEKRPQDAYFTPPEPIKVLIPHLPEKFTFIEPCAGDGRLAFNVERLTNFKGRCVYACDINPARGGIEQRDALSLTRKEVLGKDIDFIITNPPWTRSILHPMIESFAQMAPTWLLFDMDWLATKQSAPYMKYCRKIVPIGRVKWIENSKSVGKDNAMWALFDHNTDIGTQFIARAA